MFENLKAFIRHGKQANDIKKRQTTTTDQNISNSNSYPNVTLPSQFNPDLNINHEQLSATNNNHIPTNDTNGIYTNSNYSDITLISNSAIQNVYPTPTEQPHDDRNYQHVATHIVEQERLEKQREKQAKYPNLDNYEIIDKMGEGAFSVVYKAKHIPSGRFVAVKILRKFQMDQVQKQAVLKEVTIMRQLSHPNIVKFIEFIDSPTYYYIVQELAIGGEVFTQIVKYTYFSEDLCRHVIYQVAKAVRYLHEEVGIVHRDIKPENLLFMPIDIIPSKDPLSKLRKSDDPNTKQDEGEFTFGVGGGGIGLIKLADFGLSKQIWEHNTKTPCGTVGYTAPEIVRDERYSREVDMWAIGCVLYTLLCGFPPFYDERIESLTEKVARGEYTFLSPWWDEISIEAKRCVSKLLTVDPKRRYTINDLLSDPWLNKVSADSKEIPKPKSERSNEVHPIQSFNVKYSKKYKNSQELYSPAAVALRDAFDISTAVHRMGEEAALGKLNPNTIQDLVEEEEEENEENVDREGHVLESSNPTHTTSQKTTTHHHKYNYNNNSHKQQQARIFELNLGGASIIERRKNKQVSVEG
ncbi:kinase-like domain-containing protein [Scheffersomyces amazonensis]|uniref:kinase-like domain-containing protein n=1 Tax=Scheffersomyces amazonensis TaxID=1078765 RepID=UPI00315CA448